MRQTGFVNLSSLSQGKLCPLEGWCRRLSSAGQQGKPAEARARKGFLVTETTDSRVNKPNLNDLDFVHSKTWEAIGRGEDEMPSAKTGFQPGFHFGAHCQGFSGSKVFRHGGPLEIGTRSRLWEEGQLSEDVDVLDALVHGGYHIPASVCYPVLKACIAKQDLPAGRRVHALAVRLGYESNTFLANHIIRMYGSHGELQEATAVFYKLAAPDSFVWSSIILAHAKSGQLIQALELYQQMRQLDVTPDNYVFAAVIKACASAADLAYAKQIHADVLRCGVESNLYVANCMVDMYAKCGSLEHARQVFDNMPRRDVVTWTAMMAGYSQQGLGYEALSLYEGMQEEAVTLANDVTFVCLLKACASTGNLRKGQELHSQIQERELGGDVVVGNCLVHMYAKCGSWADAREVFDALPKRDAVTWTSMIAGYAEQGLCQEALALWARMEQEGTMLADPVTFVCLLTACIRVGALNEGKELHSQIRERGLEAVTVVGNSLVDLYATCGSLEDARQVFDGLSRRDLVTWNVMIAGYSRHGFAQEALLLYAEMQQEGIIQADHVTYVSLLKACARVGNVGQGKELHGQIQERGFEAHVIVGNALVDMYAKCNSLEDARRAFDKMASRDMVAWTTMIAAYAQHGIGQEALALYQSMQQEGVAPVDQVTLASLLKACASIGALGQGKQLHSQVQERGLEGDVVVGSSLVDMYAKCGSLDEAHMVFDRLPAKDVVTWTALLNGYAQHGCGQMAMKLFREMQQQGVKPSASTFSSLLVACSHEGLVTTGQYYFRSMMEDHGMVPNEYHVSCMVDVLARSGHLDEAEDLMRTMPPGNGLVVGWTSLLSACKAYGDIDLARRCFDHLIKIEPQIAAPYVLLADIYAGAGKWADAVSIQALRKSAGASKKPAMAWIEVDNKVHSFIVGENRADISCKLRSVNLRVAEKAGYIPHPELTMNPPSDKDDEAALCGHAEKLALAYGLLNTANGTTLVVTKNLRMCNDCHNGTKVMSRIENREIIVRDTHRVHHFVNGFCTCGDRH